MTPEEKRITIAECVAGGELEKALDIGSIL